VLNLHKHNYKKNRHMIFIILQIAHPVLHYIIIQY